MAQEVEEKSIWDKIGTIDYRIIYTTIIVLMIIPILNPLGIPVGVTPLTQDYYDTIMDLPDGSVILFHNWVSLSVWVDTGHILIATFNILWRIPQERDIKIICYQSGSDAYLKVHDILEVDTPEGVKPPPWREETYGETWVDLGYVPGLGEAGRASLMMDFTNMVEEDYYETPIMEIPVIQEAAKRAAPTDVLNAYDIDLMIWGSWGCTDPDAYVRTCWTQGSPPYHLPMLFMTIGNCVPNTMPYYGKDKPIVSFIPGTTGAAELEKLLDYHGDGTKMSDILNLGGIGTVIFLVLGNLAYFGKRFLEKKEE